ncbi:phosphotransferase [Flavobacteriaceae bacterium Ap0902]|nr:phosphotransferase [Flavobacteriaceae bacterium Ap0902]
MNSLINTFLNHFDSNINSAHKIAVSGSGRVNYIVASDVNTYVLTVNDNVPENESFFYLTDLLKSLNGNVPEVLAVSKDKTMYIQSYLGDKTLLQKRLENEAATEDYKRTIQQLAKLQVATFQIIDPSKLYDSTSLDEPLIYRDLFYFKNYFLDFTPTGYLQSKLLKDFQKLVRKVMDSHYKYFIFRDFQGRNVMIKDDKPYFIDYQDGMIGPIAYDLVSILWQAKAALKATEKYDLIQVYTNQIKELLPNDFNMTTFIEDYNHCLILRLLQVLGAYGKLGIIGNKPHFKESISFGIHNLKTIKDETFMDKFPTLRDIFNQLESDSMLNMNSWQN